MLNRSTRKRMRRRGPPASEARLRDDVALAQYEAVGAAEGYATAHEAPMPIARFFRIRMDLISQALTSVAGGDLLDVGCGPGMMVRELRASRAEDFSITAIDRSLAMVNVCSRKAAGASSFRALVGRVEALPFPDASFDVVLAMGVLEYADVRAALQEIERVARPDALVLITMLNPISPYRLAEWYLHGPVLRLLERFKTERQVLRGKWYGPGASGIRAYRARTLRRKVVDAGLCPADAVYFDVTLVRRWHRKQEGAQRESGFALWRWMGTAYMLAAKKRAAGGERY